jgi:eukaryotic-like serine/threonine-protein kinase
MQKSTKGKSSLIGFLFSKIFLYNLITAIVLLVLLLFLLFKFISIYTDHGEEIIVPNFYGKSIEEIESVGQYKKFDFFVIDSLFDEYMKSGAIVIQDPVAGSKVKKGRNIYVTVVASLPEMVKMPDLKDLTLRQAINILGSSNLKTGKLIYIPSFDKNAVLEQFYNGDTIMPGDTLLKGSVIDLMVGSGNSQYKIPVPFLIGKTREEAIHDINTASFNLGKEVYIDSIMDESARVYMQEPLWNSDIPYYPGDSIHLFYRSADLFNFEGYTDSLKHDTLRIDSLVTDSSEVF